MQYICYKKEGNKLTAEMEMIQATKSKETSQTRLDDYLLK